MKITQLSVFAENRPGRLQEILGILAKANINIQTLTIAEVTDFGILRLIVDRPEEAYQALKAESVTCSRTDVLAIVVENKPGALFRLMEAFSKHQLNIEYMYAYANPGQAGLHHDLPLREPRCSPDRPAGRRHPARAQVGNSR